MSNKRETAPDNGAVTSPGGESKQKKPLYDKWWFWVMIVLVIIIIAVSVGGGQRAGNGSSNAGENPGSSQSTGGATSGTGSSLTSEAGKEEIVYEKTDIQTMIDALQDNALKAEKTYQDQYIEVTGKISNFDSDGKYISIDPVNNEWNLISVMCYIKNDDQRSFLLEKSKGDTVTIKGQVTSIGEVLGYSINIAEIS